MPRGGARTGSGGKRKGAGRRPGSGGLERKTALKIAAPLIYGKSATEAVSAASILASVDEKAKWLELLEASNAVGPDWNTRRQALWAEAGNHGSREGACDCRAADSRRDGAASGKRSI